MFPLSRQLRETLLCVGFGLGVGHAEIPEHRPVRVLGIENGLESLTFNHLYQDRQGLIWIAYEQSGVGIFDGTRFHNLGLKQGLPSGLVTCLQEDATGVLWAGTYRGIAHWDGRSFIPATGPVSGKSTYAIAPHPAGGIAVGIDDGIFVGASDRTFTALPGWNGGACRALQLSPDGRSLWASGLGKDGQVRVYRWSGQTWTTFEGEEGFRRQPLEQVLSDRSGAVWAASAGTLWCLHPGSPRFEQVRDSKLQLGNRPYLSLDSEGTLWVCGSQQVFHLRRDGNWETLDTRHGLPNRRYRSLLHDREGTLWLGGAGLVKVLGGTHLRISTPGDHLPGPGVMAILRDRDRHIWIGTEAGLAHEGPKGWQRVPGTENMLLRSLVQLPDGRILACGNASHFLSVDPRSGRMEQIQVMKDQALGRLNRMALSPDGTLYLASTFAGLLATPTHEKSLNFAPVPLPGGTPREIIFDLAFDTAGRLWVAGEAGLALLEQGRWRRFAKTDGLLESTVRFVRPTRNGDLLVGYIDPLGWTRLRLQGEGLTQLEHRHAGNGSQEVVWLLGEDLEGRVWAGGAKGLDILSTASSEHMGQIHGLPSDDCNAQAFLAEPDGQVWVGTAEGLAHFRMAARPGQPPPPRPSLLAVTVGNGTSIHPRTQDLEIPHHSTFSASLAAVWLAQEGQVRLEARLLGLEEAWTPVTEGRVRYPGLATGAYTLEYRSRLGSGAWSATESFRFTVLPAWWQTWWFRMSLAGFAGACIYLFTRLRTAVLTRRNRTLEVLIHARTTQLREAKESAERASGFKSVFLATVSHELRTPLNAIRGFLDLLDRGRVRPEDVPTTVRTMKAASETLLGLINDLLDLGRIETGALELDPSPTHLRSLLETTVALLVPRIEQKDLLLLLDVDPGVPEQVNIDARRFSQMVVNLVGNAIKFTSAGHVRVRLELLRQEDKDVVLQVRVEDTGPGMPPELLSTLFQPYRQGEGPMKGQGTGLGLSITRHFAQHMGGEVGVSSELHIGSTFWFTLRCPRLTAPPRNRPLERRHIALQLKHSEFRGPMATLLSGMGATLTAEVEDILITDQPEIQATPEITLLLLLPPGHAIHHGLQTRRCIASPISARTVLAALTEPNTLDSSADAPLPTLKGRVLLADDNPANRMLAVSVLGVLGVQCHTAASGEEALETLEHEAFDLVLLDGHMPGMDGAETVREIRQRERLKALPVILFTASGRMDLATARGLGFDALLPKPMSLEETHQVLGQYLRPSEPVLPHWIRLAEVLGGQEGLKALLESFLEDGLKRLPALNTALAAHERHALERLAHDLKSNAGHLGLEDLQRAAASLESASADETWERLAQLFQTTDAAWSHARLRAEALLQTWR